MKITTKLILSLSVCICLIFIFLNTYFNKFTKQKLEAELVTEMELVGKLFAEKVESRQRAIEEIVQNTGIFSSEFINQPEKITALIKDVVAHNSGDIFGMSLAYNPSEQKKAPYFYWNDAVLAHKDLAKFYPYDKKDWFIKPYEAKKAMWSKFYQDLQGGETLMSTYSYPILNAQNDVKYILTGDLSLAWLSDELNNLSYSKYKQLIYLSSTDDGKIIFKPSKNAFSINLAKHESQKIINSHKLISIDIDNQKYFQLQIPIKKYNWNINILFAESEVKNDLNQANTVFYLLSLAGIILIILAIYIISKSITKPLNKLTEKIKLIGEGNLNTPIPYQNLPDEIGLLAKSFHTMQSDLNHHILQIKNAEAEKQRIESELLIGHQIQTALLPTETLNLSENQSFKIEGFLKSAKEIGGDLYDFFKIDRDRLFFFIGDVSGKGVPAGLHMAGIRSYIRAMAKQNQSPDEILKKLNNELCKNNDLCMFATLYCGILDLNNGTIQSANAGHENPYLLSETEKPKQWINKSGMALGIVENQNYPLATIILNKNQTLLLYTDGVIDAQNITDSAFGYPHFEQAIAIENNPNILFENINSAINTFTKNAPQFDDITLLAIKYY